MTTITFDNPTGLSPIVGDLVPSPSVARVCKAYLRRGDIRPYHAPQSTLRYVASRSSTLLQNPHTGTLYGGQLGDGVTTAGWNGTAYSLARVNGIASIFDGDTPVGDFTPPQATTAPVITVTANIGAVSTSFTNALDDVASAATPVNNVGVDTPAFINYVRSGTAGALTSFPKSEVQRALNFILDNCTVTYANSALPRTLRFELNQMLATYTSQASLTRHANDTNYTYPRNSSVQQSILQGVKNFLWGLRALLSHALLGTPFSSTPRIDVCPLDYDGDSGVTIARDVTVVSDPVAYVQGGGVPLNDSVLISVFWFCGESWLASYGFSTPLTAIDYAWSEIEAVAAAPQTYVWSGLSAASFTSIGELQPYALGTETMKSSTPQRDVHNLLRSYCYTFVDAYGREGQPSPSTTVDDTSVDTSQGIATHTFVRPTNIPPYATGIKVYRAVSPHDAASIDDAAWMCVVQSPLSASTIQLPDIDFASYDVLDTAGDTPVTDPKFLCVTGTDHAVCVSDGAVCVSKRHKFWAYPYDRRVELPLGLQVVSLKAVDNIVYVGTNGAPMVIIIGQDHGDDGLQMDDTLLTHAPYGVKVANSFVSTPFGVMYWSHVGVVMLAGKNVSVVTAGLLDEDQVPDYLPVCAVYQNGMYLSFKSDVCTVLDVPDPTFAEQVKAPMTQANVGAIAACLGTDGLVYLLPPDGYTCKVWDMTNGVPLDIHYKTYSQVLPCDTVFYAARVYGSGISGTLRGYDSVGLLFELDVDSSRPLRLPRHIAKEHVALEFIGSAASISKLVIASAMEDLV